MNALLILKEIAGIVVDVVRGSKCPVCWGRYRDLALHGYIDHAGDLGVPEEPSRFAT